MSHDGILTLNPGTDRFLIVLFPIIIVTAVLGFALSPASYFLKFLCISITLFSFALAKYFHQKMPGCPLILLSDGRIRWRNYSNQWHEGLVAEQTWTTDRYAVIRVQTHYNRHSIIISRSLQSSGTYRVLLSWLRLRDSDIQPE